MNILRKFWQWLCRFASDSWRILQREIAERKQDIASITKVELQQIAKTEGKHFFLFLNWIQQLVFSLQQQSLFHILCMVDLVA